MDIAILIILIVALIILLALSFFIFQIWVHSKEAKLQVSSFLAELQKGFKGSDSTITDGRDKIISSIATENKLLIASLTAIKEQLHGIINDVRKNKDDINSYINLSLEASDLKLNDAFEALKTKGFNRIGELNDTLKVFREQLEDRIKVLDKHLTEKLVYDLTELTKKYSAELVEKNTGTLSDYAELTKTYSLDFAEKNKEILKTLTEVVEEFSTDLKQKHQETISKFLETSKEIREEQNKVFKAITDPLQLKN